jgi:hypothetical protein
MIVVKLYGGLGNQMFQYAFGRSLALSYKTPLWVDRSWFARIEPGLTTREFSLGGFRINARVLPDGISRALFSASGAGSWLEKVGARIARISERTLGYDAAAHAAPRHAYLDGYWQTERYFASTADVIRADFSLRRPMTKDRREILRSITRNSSVSVHVRRGDYVSNPTANAFHGVCSAEWYERAITMMREIMDECRLLVVFSDDIAWARATLVSRKAIFVGNDRDGRDYEDIHLMAACRGHIIANSSFGWWGAWLDPSPKKIVIAPQRWFLAESDSRDRIPPGWIRL